MASDGAPPRQRPSTLAETIWTLRTPQAVWRGELRFLSESWGWRAANVRDTDRVITPVHGRAEAVRWVEAMRAVLPKD